MPANKELEISRSSNLESENSDESEPQRRMGVTLSGKPRRSPGQLRSDFWRHALAMFDLEDSDDIILLPQRKSYYKGESIFHCKVYIFAERYLVKGLRQRSLRQLRTSLRILKTNMILPVIMRDIIEIMGYIYSGLLPIEHCRER